MKLNLFKDTIRNLVERGCFQTESYHARWLMTVPNDRERLPLSMSETLEEDVSFAHVFALQRWMDPLFDEVEQVVTTEDSEYYLFSILITILSGNYDGGYSNLEITKICGVILSHELNPGC